MKYNPQPKPKLSRSEKIARVAGHLNDQYLGKLDTDHYIKEMTLYGRRSIRLKK